MRQRWWEDQLIDQKSPLDRVDGGVSGGFLRQWMNSSRL